MNGYAFIPRAQDGESPLSVLRRAAEGHHFKTTSSLLRGIDPKRDDAASALASLAHDSGRYAEVCRSLGVSDHEIRKICYQRVRSGRKAPIKWLGLEVPVQALNLPLAKHCPQCLREVGYARAIWDHRAVLACEIHGCLLIKACPKCGRAGTYDEPPGACGCVVDLRGQTRVAPTLASFVPAIVRARDQQKLDLVDALYRQLDLWRRMQVITRERLLHALYDLYQGRPPKFSPATSGEPTIHPRVLVGHLLGRPQYRRNALALLEHFNKPVAGSVPPDLVIPAEHAAWVLGTQRVSLQKLLTDEHVRPATARKGIRLQSINQLLIDLSDGGVHVDRGEYARKMRAGKDVQSLSSVISSIRREQVRSLGFRAIEGLDGLRVERLPRRELRTPDGWMTVPELQKFLGVNDAAVRNLIASRKLPAKKGAGPHACSWLVARRDAAIFHDTFIFGATLARLVKASVRTFSAKLRSAGVRPVSGPGIDGNPSFLFKRADVAAVDMAAQIAAI